MTLNNQGYISSLAQAEAAAKAAQQNLNINANVGSVDTSAIERTAAAQRDYTQATQGATAAASEQVAANQGVIGSMAEMRAAILSTAGSQRDAVDALQRTGLTVTQATAAYREYTEQQRQAAAASQETATVNREASVAKQLDAATTETDTAATVENTVAKDASNVSLGRLNASVNESGAAHLRLGGPLGVAAAALAIVGGAALKEAADLESAMVRLNNFSAANPQNLNGLNSNFNLGTNSRTELLQAYAPVAGELNGLSGAANDAGAAVKVLAAAQDLAQASGEKVGTTTRAIVETLRNYRLAASDSAMVSDALYDSQIKLGQSSDQIAQKYGLVREQLGILKPTLADTKEIVDATGQAGADGSRQISAFTGAIDKATDGSKQSHDALKALDIKIVDATGHYLPMKTILEEMAQSSLGLGDAQAVAGAATLVGARDASTLVDYLVTERQRMEEAKFESQALAKAHLDGSQQADTLAGAFDHAASKAKDLAANLGGNLLTFGGQARDLFKDLATWVENFNKKLDDAPSHIATFIGAITGLNSFFGSNSLFSQPHNTTTSGPAFFQNGQPGGGANGVLPPSWYAAIEAHESGFPLPSPGHPEPMFGLMGMGPAGTQRFPSNSGDSSPPGSSQLFNTVSEGVDELNKTIAKLVPDYQKYVQANDFHGLVSALAPNYLGSPVPSDATNWANQLTQFLKEGRGDPAPFRAYADPGASGGWTPPVSGYTITQPFGSTENPGGVEPGGVHQGVDLGVPAGTIVDAARAGIVAAIDPVKGIVKEAIDGGMSVIYEHMDPIMVKVGDHLAQGQAIAKVGDHPFDAQNWPSTGPHLHFQVNDASGNPIDPTQFLTGAPVPGSLESHLSTGSTGSGTPSSRPGTTGTPGGYDPYGPSNGGPNAASQLESARGRGASALEGYNESLTRGAEARPLPIQIIDPAMIDAAQSKIDALNVQVSAAQAQLAPAVKALTDALAKSDTDAIDSALKTLAPLQKIYNDDLTNYQHAQTEKSKLLSEQKAQASSTEQAGVSQDTLTASLVKLQDKQREGSKLVTDQTIADDQSQVSSTLQAANDKAAAVQSSIDEMVAANAAGDTTTANLKHDEVVKEQKDLDALVTANRTAVALQNADQVAQIAQQKAAAEASRTLNADQIAQTKDVIGSSKALGLQIPDAWKTGLSEARDATQAAYAQLIVLDQVLHGQMSDDDRKAFDEYRVTLANKVNDTRTAYDAMQAAAQLYNQGVDAQSKAQFAREKADRAADLTDVREKNAEKLASDLNSIQQNEQAQLASLATSSEVSRIQAQSYAQQASAATDLITRQKALLSQQLAEQTAALQDAEAKQLQVIRDGEQEKLKAYNDILLQYQEAQQTTNARLLQNQADLDLAKADTDIALAELQIQLASDVANQVDISTDTQVQDLQTYLSQLPAYIAGVNQSSQAWENYGETVASGLLKAQNAVSGLTQFSNDAASKVQQTTQNQLSLLQAHSAAQSTALSDTKKDDPQAVALQHQIDQLTVIKDQNNLVELAQQQQLVALQSQNTVLADQINLLHDEEQASTAYLQTSNGLKNIAVLRDQAEVALLALQNSEQQQLVEGEKEQLAVLQSENAVTSAQLKLTNDQAVASTSYLASSAQLKELATQQAQVQLQIQQQVNVAAEGELASLNAQLETQKAQLAVTQAELKLAQDQTNASPQFLALTAQLNQLKVQQDALSVAGRKNDALDKEITQLEAQQKLMQSQTTAADTQLQAQEAQQNVQQDQLNLQVAQTDAELTKSAELAQQLAIIQAQMAVLQAQQGVSTAQAALDAEALTEQQAIATVQQDQLTLQIAQGSVITSQQAQLTLEIAAYDRQTTQLQAQQKLMNDTEALAADALTQQQAIAKVQTDQLSLQIAQVKAQDDMANGVSAVLSQLQSELSIEQAITKVQQDGVSAQQQSLSLQQQQSAAAQQSGSNSQGGPAAGYYVGANGQHYAPYQYPDGHIGPPPGFVPQGGGQPTGPTATPTGPVPSPSNPYGFGPGNIPPTGSVFTSGPWQNMRIANELTINIGGQTLTELVLQNLSSGQTMEVTVP